MPRAPDIPDLEKINFITAYMFQLCVPPFWAFVEFAKEPTGNLFMVLFGLDWQDFLKEWLRPGRGRYRNPGRHGRKRPYLTVSFDPNDYVASRPRAAAQIYPGIDLPGARAIFYLGDQADKIAISAAVLEGVTDIGYEGLLGVIENNPNNCPTLPFVHRHSDELLFMPGVIPDDDPIPANILDAAQLFQATGPHAYTTFEGKWRMAWSGIIEPYSIGGCTNWRAAIGSTTRGIVEVGNPFNLNQGEQGHVSVSAELEPGEFAFPCRTNDFGSVTIANMQVLCFGGGLW